MSVAQHGGLGTLAKVPSHLSAKKGGKTIEGTEETGTSCLEGLQRERERERGKVLGHEEQVMTK